MSEENAMSEKILVIDDEQDIVDFQKSYLTRRGYAVFTATNTKDAIETIKKESVDIVFCDLRLKTDTTGLDILEQAKKIKPEIIFYLITGFIDKETEQRGLALGVKEILSKPISCADFLKKIQEATP